jgi:hypothetical protein
LILFDCDCQFLQKPLFDLPSTDLYIIIKHQIATQDIVTRVLLFLSLELLPNHGLLFHKTIVLLFGIIETSFIRAGPALLVQFGGVLLEAHEHFDLEGVDLEISIEVDQPLVVHVYLVEPPHYIISFII